MVLSALLSISAIWSNYYLTKEANKKSLEISAVTTFIIEQLIFTSYDYYLCVCQYPNNCLSSVQNFQKILIILQVFTELQFASINL